MCFMSITSSAHRLSRYMGMEWLLCALYDEALSSLIEEALNVLKRESSERQGMKHRDRALIEIAEQHSAGVLINWHHKQPKSS